VRDLYRSTPAETRDLSFFQSHQKDCPIQLPLTTRKGKVRTYSNLKFPMASHSVVSYDTQTDTEDLFLPGVVVTRRTLSAKGARFFFPLQNASQSNSSLIQVFWVYCNSKVNTKRQFEKYSQEMEEQKVQNNVSPHVSSNIINLVLYINQLK
jgi:hypothetical protein